VREIESDLQNYFVLFCLKKWRENSNWLKLCSFTTSSNDMILYQWYYIFQASKVCVFVTRGRHFGAQESVWSYFFEEKPRKILVKLTQGPQNHSRGQVTKIVLNKIILNVWIENGPVLLYGPGIELAFRSNSYYYLSFPREYFGQIKTSTLQNNCRIVICFVLKKWRENSNWLTDFKMVW
jgi:hypothetical protein